VNRYLFNAMAGISLLLFVATCILWVKSYQVETTTCRQIGLRLYAAESLNGKVQFEITSGWPPQPKQFQQWEFSSTKVGSPYANLFAGPMTWSFLGFGYSSITFTLRVQYAPSPVVTSPARSRMLTVPLWSVCLMTGWLPPWWLCWRRRSGNVGICRICGYDLRATPYRCPECGTPTADVCDAPAVR
jgi:hypothetical protein